MININAIFCWGFEGQQAGAGIGGSVDKGNESQKIHLN